MGRYRLAVFDFDGTLADTLPWLSNVLNQVAERYRFKKVDETEREAMRRMGSRELIAYLGVPPWKVPFIAQHVRSLMARDIDKIALFDGIAASLRDLHERGVGLAVLSSNAVDNVRGVLGPEHAGRIAHYECGADLFGKASKLKRLLQRTRTPPEAAILIGDEIRDGEAAASVGVAFGAVAWGYNDLEALRRCAPSEVFRSPSELALRVG